MTPLPGIDATISILLELSRKPVTRGLDRSEIIQRSLQELGISSDPPPENFEAIYIHTIVEYGANRPKQVLSLWRDDFVRAAFRKSFYSGDPHFLSSEVDNVMLLREEQGILKDLDYDLRQEIELFAEQFNSIIDRIRTPYQARQDQQIATILRHDQLQIDKLDNISQLLQNRHSLDPGPSEILTAVPAPAPGFLPPHYVERLNHLDNVKELLSLDSEEAPDSLQSRAIVFRGIGGSGKTTLVQALAQSGDLLERFPGGVHWFDLTGPDLSPSDRLNRLLLAIGVDPQPFDSEHLKKEAIRTSFAEQSSLLVIDGVTDASQCHPFLEVLTSGACVLITTRNVQLAARLQLSDEITISGFTPIEAREAVESRLGTSYSDTDWQNVIEPVIQGLGFHPLALSLATSHVLMGQVAWEDLLGLIRSGALPQAIDFEDPNQASESLELTFSDSFSRFPDDLRSKFQWLSVLAMGKPFFLPDAARIISGMPEQIEQRGGDTGDQEGITQTDINWISEQKQLAAETLDSLVQRGALDRSQLPGGGEIYRFHPVIQNLALSELRDAGRLESALNHHALVYYSETLGDVDAPAPFHAYLSSRYQVLEVLERAWSRISQGPTLPLPTLEVAEASIIVIATTMSRQWSLMGENEELAKWLSRALDIAHAHEQPDNELYLRKELAHAHLHIGNFEQAEYHYEAARKLVDASAEPTEVILAKINSMLPTLYRGQLGDAIPILEDALDEARKIEDQELLGIALGTLAHAYTRANQLDDAIRCQEEALTLAIYTNDQNAYGKRIGNLGNQYLERAMGDLRNALGLFHTSRLTAIHTGNVQSQANRLLNLANAYNALGDREYAAICIKQAIEILAEIASPYLGTAKALEEIIADGRAYEPEFIQYGEIFQHAEASIRGDRISDIRLRRYIQAALDREESFPDQALLAARIQLVLDGELDSEKILHGMDDPQTINLRLLLLNLRAVNISDLITRLVVTITLALEGNDQQLQEIPKLICFLDNVNPIPTERVGLIRIARGVQDGETDPQHLTAEIDDPLLRDTLRIMIAAGPPQPIEPDSPFESDAEPI